MLRLTKTIWQVYNYLAKLACQPFYNNVLIAITYSILKKLSNKPVHDLKPVFGERRETTRNSANYYLQKGADWMTHYPH